MKLFLEIPALCLKYQTISNILDFTLKKQCNHQSSAAVSQLTVIFKLFSNQSPFQNVHNKRQFGARNSLTPFNLGIFIGVFKGLGTKIGESCMAYGGPGGV